jgi:hypothetical protein
MRFTILNSLYANECRAGMHPMQPFVHRGLGWHEFATLLKSVARCHIPNPQDGSQHTQHTLMRLDSLTNGGLTVVPPVVPRHNRCFLSPSRTPFLRSHLNKLLPRTRKPLQLMRQALPLSSAQPRLHRPSTVHAWPVHPSLMLRLMCQAPPPPLVSAPGTCTGSTLKTGSPVLLHSSTSCIITAWGCWLLPLSIVTAVQETRLPLQTPLAAETGLQLLFQLDKAVQIYSPSCCLALC